MAQAKTPKFYHRMPQGERAARAFFQAGANDTLMRVFGLMPVDAREAGDLFGPCTEYVAMTDVGRLDITVYDDWVATRFALPDQARAVVECNPYSGKWNHSCYLSRNTHGSTAEARWKGDAITAVLQGLHQGLEAVQARPWAVTPVSMTRADAEAAGLDMLRVRAAMGDEITIEDLDRGAIEAEYRASLSDTETSDAFTRFLMNQTDVELLFSYLPWRERVANQGAEALMTEDVT